MSGARAACVGVGVSNLVSLLWAAGQLPQSVASHFDAAGSADGWSSRTEHLLFSGLIGVAVIVGLPLLAGALTRGSGAFINVPHKDYWLDEKHPARRVEFCRRFTDDMCTIAALTGLLLLWVQLETVWANQQEPPQMSPAATAAIIGYLVLIVAWAAWMVTARYRPPPQEPDGGQMRPLR